MLRQRARGGLDHAGQPDGGPSRTTRTAGDRSRSPSSCSTSAGSPTRARRPRASRPPVVPDRRRQDRGLPRPDRVTVLLRRLRRKDAGRGVTVLMRYTLRLLTIQQFERAAALICALEVIRSRTGRPRRAPISIGLWVGRDGTPATVQDARAALDKIRVGQEVEKGNPVQVRACPWCGTKLDHRAYWIAKSDPRLVISCRNKTCAFAAGLPVHVVDEDIYREQPTLIIATADKFATLPWVKGAHRALRRRRSAAPARADRPGRAASDLWAARHARRPLRGSDRPPLHATTASARR